MNNHHAKLGLLLPAVLNPATAALVGIAAIAVGIYRLLPDDDEEESGGKVLTNDSKPALVKPGEQTPAVNSGDDQPLAEASDDVMLTIDPTPKPSPAPISEVDQSEMIRKAMSELGKRSAAARAKKRNRSDAQKYI